MPGQDGDHAVPCRPGKEHGFRLHYITCEQPSAEPLAVWGQSSLLAVVRKKRVDGFQVASCCHRMKFPESLHQRKSISDSTETAGGWSAENPATCRCLLETIATKHVFGVPPPGSTTCYDAMMPHLSQVRNVRPREREWKFWQETYPASRGISY